MFEPKKIRVAVNGYGVIGKRVAAAVALLGDMSLAGVSEVVADWRARTALRNGFRLFGASGEHTSGMRSAGLEVTGSEYNGKTYYFCSKDCNSKFDSNPAQYAK